MLVEKIAHQKRKLLLDRRLFLKQLLHSGVIGAVSLEALSSCDLPSQSSTIVNWLTNGDNKGTFQSLAAYFNQINQDGIIINAISGTDYNTLRERFINQDNTFDLVSLDITWIREFTSQPWLTPLDSYWPIDSEQPKRTDYLGTPLSICSWDGQLWAAPLHTDIGILYYRTDSPNSFISPSHADKWTWDDLKNMAQQAQTSNWCSGGFLWEGSWIANAGKEGLLCLFLEILDGFGGQLFDDAKNPQKVLIESPEAIKALEHMKTWNTTISAYYTEKGQKEKASNSSGDDCANAWEECHAAFMRNWPAYISQSDNANYPVSGKYSVAPLPRQVLTTDDQQNSDAARHTRSCLGGWQLGINTYSTKKDSAWLFIKWMLGSIAQQYLAHNESFAVTLKSVYNDPYINKLNPHYKPLLEIINNAQYRPLLPNYQQALAEPVQAIVSRLLTEDSYTSTQAVQDLKQTLKDALPKEKSSPSAH